MRKAAAEAVVERLFEILLGAVGRVTEQLLYIGIEGDEPKVAKLAKMIKQMANYKDESPGRRDFI